MSPLLMLWTAPPPARECHKSGCCNRISNETLLQCMSLLVALSGQSSCARVCPLLDQSGQRPILALNCSAAIDPTATLGVHCGNGFDAGFNPYQITRLSR
jgi:hypothetical protein